MLGLGLTQQIPGSGGRQSSPQPSQEGLVPFPPHTHTGIKKGRVKVKEGVIFTGLGRTADSP